MARKDDVHRQYAVSRSRGAIYREVVPKSKLKPVIVNGTFVEARLKNESLVPTLVCVISVICHSIFSNLFV